MERGVYTLRLSDTREGNRLRKSERASFVSFSCDAEEEREKERTQESDLELNTSQFLPSSLPKAPLAASSSAPVRSYGAFLAIWADWSGLIWWCG